MFTKNAVKNQIPNGQTIPNDVPEINQFELPEGGQYTIYANGDMVIFAGRRYEIRLSILDVAVHPRGPTRGQKMGEAFLCAGPYLGIRMWLEGWAIAGGNGNCYATLEVRFGEAARVRVWHAAQSGYYEVRLPPADEAEHYYEGLENVYRLG
jgi:hypothetical protein